MTARFSLNPVALSLLLCGLFALSACGLEGDAEFGDAAETEEINLSLEGIRSSFDPNYIVSDDVFEGRLYDADTAAVQAFLERNPYGTRSWLAGHTVNGKSVAQVIVEESHRHDINPMMMLARLQAEQGLISKTSRPTDRQLDAALGCDCPDNRACAPEHYGFDKQISCGARYLRVNFERSRDREGTYYKMGSSKTTLDGHSVRPSNHATAAFYNYTPWRGSSSHQTGAWLTWQITKKYLDHLTTQNPGSTQETPWVGDLCESSDECSSSGSCFAAQGGGMCTLGCDGTCPDRPGKATTFCVSLDGGQTGSCVPRAHQLNNFCQGLPNAARQSATRFVQHSNARVMDQDVCLPTPAPVVTPEPAPEPDPMTPAQPGSGSEATPDAFVGTLCDGDNQCNFAHNNEIGQCIGAQTNGMCSLQCAGYCPDSDGHAPTFCVSLDGGQTGSCVPRAHDLNQDCERDADMIRAELPRHVGSSGARSASRIVCVPFLPAGG